MRWQRTLRSIGVALLPFLLPMPLQAQQIFPSDVNFAQANFDTVIRILKYWAEISLRYVLAIAAIALVITGYIYITSEGNSQKIEQAKQALLFIGIGVGVVLGAYLIVTTLGTQLTQ